MNNTKRARINVFGQVQGVYFRQKTKDKAESLGLVGWVKNTEDGNLIIMSQGPEERIEALKSWVRVGPKSAKVEKVKVKWLKPSDDLVGFEIII